MAARRDPFEALKRRRKAERRGHIAETIAALSLRLKGYSIIARRYRSALGEIDIVARRGRTIAFVEVKARRDAGVAVDAVPAAAQVRIRAAADHWIAGQEARGRDLRRFSYRFDIVAVVPRRWPVHLTDAF